MEHAGDQPRDRDRGGGGQRHQRPPVRAPAERDRQQAAEQWTDQVRHPGARAPDAQRGAAALGGKARHRAGQRGRADQPGAGALDHAGDDQLAEALGQCAGERAEREQRQTGQRQPSRAEPVDQFAAGDQQQRVGREVGRQDGRGRAALDRQPVRDRRQRDRDQRAVELQQRRRRGARGEPRPGRSGYRRLGVCGELSGLGDGRAGGHECQYRGCPARPPRRRPPVPNLKMLPGAHKNFAKRRRTCC